MPGIRSGDIKLGKEVLQELGNYLSTKESWNNKYYKSALADKRFNLDSGWYESPKNWHSFNDFFSRKLSSPSVRPIAKKNDDSLVVFPADSECQGIWDIDKNSRIVTNDGEGVAIKSNKFTSVSKLLEKSKYADSFAGGTLSHAFLDVDDYHRYHFPVSGTIKEIVKIPALDAVGGIIYWDKEKGRYMLDCKNFGWQTIETRGLVVIDTGKYGIVAVMPIGMSQISSVNFDKSLKVGDKVKKGDELGYFLFGGSDMVTLFQKKTKVELQVKENKDGNYPHSLMGEAYLKLR